MKKETKYKLQFEILWWIVTALITLLVVYPIISKTSEFPFILPNILGVVAFITFTRYIFLLKHTFLAYNFPLKVIIFFLMIPVVIYFVYYGLAEFQIYSDERGLDKFLAHLPTSQSDPLIKYISTEYIFFLTAGIIGAIIFAFRLMISIWRVRNRGKV